MISKTLKYKDFDGLTVEETFWFHLSNADIIVLDSTIPGGITPVLQKVMADGTDNAYIVETFQLLLAKAVGRRSEDGKRFVKNADITADFMETNAWEAFLLDLLANAGDAVEWFNGVMPNNVQEEAAKNKAVEADVFKKFDDKLLEQQLAVRQAGGKVYDLGGDVVAELKAPVDMSVDLMDLQRQEYEKTMASRVQAHTPSIVDEWTEFEKMSANDSNWKSYSPQELLEMDDDIFNALVGPVKAGTDKILLSIMMRRRARRNGN